MKTITIDIIEHIFPDNTEILIIENPALNYKFVLDIDKILDEDEISTFTHAYTELGEMGGIARKGKFAPWHEAPFSSDTVLGFCKWCRNVIHRTARIKWTGIKFIVEEVI